MTNDLNCTPLRDLLWAPLPAIREAVEKRLRGVSAGDCTFKWRAGNIFQFRSRLAMTDGADAAADLGEVVTELRVVGDVVTTRRYDLINGQVRHVRDKFEGSMWSADAPALVHHLRSAAYHAVLAEASAGRVRFVGVPDTPDRDFKRIHLNDVPYSLRDAQAEDRIDFSKSVLWGLDGAVFRDVSVETIAPPKPRALSSDQAKFERALSARIAKTSHEGKLTREAVVEMAAKFGVGPKPALKIRENYLNTSPPETQNVWRQRGRPKTSAS